jgi:hypothetical protein
MDLFLAISQGTGLALATGVRPFLPPLLAGVLARADLGVNFTGTDFAFLESIPFLAAMLAITALASAGERVRAGRSLMLVTGGIALVLGALEFAGSLADEGAAAGPGIPAGAACALLGFASASTFLGRAAARLAVRDERNEEGTAKFLTVYADAAALAIAALAIAVPPVSYVALGFLAWLLLERRRREASKYEGLRVLR